MNLFRLAVYSGRNIITSGSEVDDDANDEHRGGSRPRNRRDEGGNDYNNHRINRSRMGSKGNLHTA